MCEAFAKRDAMIRKEAEEKFISEIAKRDAIIRKEAEEKFASEIAKANLEREKLLIEIKELKRQLDEARK